MTPGTGHMPTLHIGHYPMPDCTVWVVAICDGRIHYAHIKRPTPIPATPANTESSK